MKIFVTNFIKMICLNKIYALINLYFYYQLFNERAAAVDITTNVHLQEKRYRISFLNNTEEMPNDLCNLSKPIKLEICHRVIQHFTEGILVPYYGLHEKVYFNKILSFTEEVNCDLKNLKFNYEFHLRDTEYWQNMFPCFGRSQPMRTDWIVDDNVDLIYLSGGPEPDSVYVYVHIKLVESDFFLFYALMTNFQLDNLRGLNLKWIDASGDMQYLKQISYNMGICVMEIYYLRTISKQDPDYDPVCVLAKEMKMLLCKYLLQTAKFTSYKFDNLEFENHSLECETQTIKFKCIHTNKYSNDDKKRTMYPCYNKNVAKMPSSSSQSIYSDYYISSGTRPKSVYVFERVKETNKFEFVSFIENIPKKLVRFKKRKKRSFDLAENKGTRMERGSTSGTKKQSYIGTTETEGDNKSEVKEATNTEPTQTEQDDETETEEEINIETTKIQQSNLSEMEKTINTQLVETGRNNAKNTIELTNIECVEVERDSALGTKEASNIESINIEQINITEIDKAKIEGRNPLEVIEPTNAETSKAESSSTSDIKEVINIESPETKQSNTEIKKTIKIEQDSPPEAYEATNIITTEAMRNTASSEEKKEVIYIDISD